MLPPPFPPASGRGRGNLHNLWLFGRGRNLHNLLLGSFHQWGRNFHNFLLITIKEGTNSYPRTDIHIFTIIIWGTNQQYFVFLPAKFNGMTHATNIEETSIVLHESFNSHMTNPENA